MSEATPSIKTRKPPPPKALKRKLSSQADGTCKKTKKTQSFHKGNVDTASRQQCQKKGP